MLSKRQFYKRLPARRNVSVAALQYSEETPASSPTESRSSFMTMKELADKAAATDRYLEQLLSRPPRGLLTTPLGWLGLRANQF